MLQTRWLTFGVAWLILLAGYYRLLAVPNRTPAQRVTVFTSLGYLMVVAWLVFAPVGLILPDSYKALSYFYMVPYNLHPFVHVDPEFLANILLTGPLGVYCYLWRPHWSWWQVALAGLVPGLVIESAQFASDWLFHTLRVVDIDDVITNWAGLVLGYVVVWGLDHTPLRTLIKPFRLR